MDRRNPEKLWLNAIANLPTGVIIVRRDLTVVLWNRCVESWTNRASATVIGSKLTEVFPHLAGSHYALRFDSAFNGGGPTIFSPLLHPNMIPSTNHDGSKRILKCMFSVIYSASGEDQFAMLSLEDVSELSHRLNDVHTEHERALKEIALRKEAEGALEVASMGALQASKMAALGEMAAGVAHEINNPLTIISGFAQQLTKLLTIGDAPINPAVAKAIKNITQTADRIAAIIRGLRAFSRDGSQDEPEFIAFGRMLSDSADLCSARFKSHGVELRLPEEATFLVKCRPVQVTQVIINLLNNAFDAVQDYAEKWVAVEVAEAGDFVVCSVTDSGTGIPKHIAERIMQPFFTTKGTGKGTGLGLSISKSIVEQLGGTLDINSESPNTQFRISLPKGEASSQPGNVA